MKSAVVVSIFAVLTIFAFNGLAQTVQVPVKGPSATADPKTPLFPLADLREGMHGVARTVFRGSQPEEFNVEILGVLPGGIGPKQDLIVGRLSGGGADRTGVFAGMSGSPVYIDGKLVGAISYSFPFSKEPICGITPIEQMVAIFERKQNAEAKPADPRPVSFMELASTDLNLSLGLTAPSGTVPASSKLSAMTGQSFQPIATPLTFSGFSQGTLDRFAPQLLQAGLVPVAATGASAAITPMKKADETTLVGGDSVSMQLARGDYSLAAAGTVTWRDGEKIYAFGHPFLGLGSSDLPMSESHVVTVIPNMNNSFKLAVADSMVGSMTQDRATGVFGKLGQAPKMIPVKIVLNTSRGQTQEINFEVAKDDFLTPLLLNLATFNALTANERGLGDSTIDLKGEIKLKGEDPIELQRRFAGPQAGQFAAAAAAIPVATLFRSRFDDLQIDQITLNLDSIDGSKTASLERIAVDKMQVHAGDAIEVQAFVRSDSGRVFVQRIPMIIPKDTAPGPLSVIVGDGNVIQQNAAIQQFVPKNLGELVDTINKMKAPDRLYSQIVRTSSGAIIGVSEMPNLPPSVMATLNNDRTAGGVKPAVQSVISEKEIPPAEFIISGQQTLAIEVVK
ncbi:MAG TPA: hypothetical protein VL325_06920 [Pyrinomonadaceae bacterium]|nr:hypothetical protein [Pyrinomonadaceae bacterium]